MKPMQQQKSNKYVGTRQQFDATEFGLQGALRRVIPYHVRPIYRQRVNNVPLI